MYIKVMNSEHGDTRHHRHVDTEAYKKNNAWDLFPGPFERRLREEESARIEGGQKK